MDEKQSAKNGVVLSPIDKRRVLSHNHDKSPKKRIRFSRRQQCTSSSNIENQQLATASGAGNAQKAHFSCKRLSSDCLTPRWMRRVRSSTKQFSWPHIANDVYPMVNNCATCARTRKKLKGKHNMETFLTSGALKYTAMDIFDPLLQKKDKIYFSKEWRANTPRWKEQWTRRKWLLQMTQLCFPVIQLSHTVFLIIRWKTAALNFRAAFSRHDADCSNQDVSQYRQAISRREGRSKDIAKQHSHPHRITAPNTSIYKKYLFSRLLMRITARLIAPSVCHRIMFFLFHPSESADFDFLFSTTSD